MRLRIVPRNPEGFCGIRSAATAVTDDSRSRVSCGAGVALFGFDFFGRGDAKLPCTSPLRVTTPPTAASTADASPDCSAAECRSKSRWIEASESVGEALSGGSSSNESRAEASERRAGRSASVNGGSRPSVTCFSSFGGAAAAGGGLPSARSVNETFESVERAVAPPPSSARKGPRPSWNETVFPGLGAGERRLGGPISEKLSLNGAGAGGDGGGDAAVCAPGSPCQSASTEDVRKIDPRSGSCTSEP